MSVCLFACLLVCLFACLLVCLFGCDPCVIARANVLGHNIFVLFATLCAEASFACTWATQNVIGDPNGLFIARAADRVDSDQEGGGVVGVPMQDITSLSTGRERSSVCVCVRVCV